MEYQLLKDMDHSSILSDGLLVYPEESYSNNKLIWSTSHNQGVCFFVDETNERNTISYKVRFDTKSGEMDFALIYVMKQFYTIYLSFDINNNYIDIMTC